MANYYDPDIIAIADDILSKTEILIEVAYKTEDVAASAQLTVWADQLREYAQALYRLSETSEKPYGVVAEPGRHSDIRHARGYVERLARLAQGGSFREMGKFALLLAGCLETRRLVYRSRSKPSRHRRQLAPVHKCIRHYLRSRTAIL